MIHVEHSDKVIEGLQLIFVELPKFTPKNFSEKKMLVLWLRFLTEIGGKTDEVPEELLSDPIVSKALNVVEESAFTPTQLYSYEKFWDAISVEKTLYYGGSRKGIAEGKAEGKAEGIAEGKAEEQRLIAAQFKKLGTAPEIIAQCTGLSYEEIRKL